MIGRHKGIEELVNLSVDKLHCDLRAIFLFGSGNTDEFINKLSDLDFIYILSHINQDMLTQIAEIRKRGNEFTGYKVDIKPFTLDEFKAGIKGKGTFEFFNGWGLEMIRMGHQKCLYKTDEIDLGYQISLERIQSDSLERAHYYITKLRKTLGSDDAIILRGERKILDSMDFLKVCTSAIKNVLTFCLAYQGEFVYLTKDVINFSEIKFGNIDSIIKLMEHRKSRYFKLDSIIAAYNRTEQIYQNILGGKNG